MPAPDVILDNLDSESDTDVSDDEYTSPLDSKPISWQYIAGVWNADGSLTALVTNPAAKHQAAQVQVKWIITQLERELLDICSLFINSHLPASENPAYTIAEHSAATGALRHYLLQYQSRETLKLIFRETLPYLAPSKKRQIIYTCAYMLEEEAMKARIKQLRAEKKTTELRKLIKAQRDFAKQFLDKLSSLKSVAEGTRIRFNLRQIRMALEARHGVDNSGFEVRRAPRGAAAAVVEAEPAPAAEAAEAADDGSDTEVDEEV